MSLVWLCCVTPGSWLDLSGCFLICEVSLKDQGGLPLALCVIASVLASLLPEVWERWR